MAWQVAAAGAAGLLSLIGGDRANREARRESARNRSFQERMRNTQWQAAVADMEAAGINPALAYSQGPNAAPGGSMAGQMDAVSPAVSSAMHMRRMSADLKLLKAQTEKAQKEEEILHQKYRVDKWKSDYMLGIQGDRERQPILEHTEAEIRAMVEEARKRGATADIMGPLADLSNRMGEWLPILGLLSQMSPGGLLRRGGKLATRRRSIAQFRKGLNR